MFEFTKPPTLHLLNRRRCARSRFVMFTNHQKHPAVGTRRKRCGRPESSGPNDGSAIQENRPVPALPNGDTSFLEKSLDLFHAGSAPWLVLVPRSPVSELQRTGQRAPVQTTGLTLIIYGMRAAGRFCSFNQFQGNLNPGGGHAQHSRRRGGALVIERFGAGTAEPEPFEGAANVQTGQLQASVALPGAGKREHLRDRAKVDPAQVALGPLDGATDQAAAGGYRQGGERGGSY